MYRTDRLRMTQRAHGPVPGRKCGMKAMFPPDQEEYKAGEPDRPPKVGGKLVGPTSMNEPGGLAVAAGCIKGYDRFHPPVAFPNMPQQGAPDPCSDPPGLPSS